MKKRTKNMRVLCRKAYKAIFDIQKKFPDGISDATNISDKERAWIQIKLQHFCECTKYIKFPSKPDWLETMRITRNKTAHQRQDISDKEFSDLCKIIFSNIKQITEELNDNIKRYHQTSKKKRKFEDFSSSQIGTEEERKQLVDAMEDFFSPSEPEDIKLEFSQNKFSEITKNILSEITKESNIESYCKSHIGMAENLQTDILAWLEKTNNLLNMKDPFVAEAEFIEEQKKLSSIGIALDISSNESKIKSNYEKISSINEVTRGSIAASSMDFDFYHKKFLAEKEIVNISDNNLGKDDIGKIEKHYAGMTEKIKWKNLDNIRILSRNFIADMEKNLVERKNKWEMEVIETERKKFSEQLYVKIQNFMKLEKLAAPLIKSFGKLWDLSEGIFEISGFEILETFADLLERDESLQELAELLGRQDKAQSLFEKEMRDKVVIKHEYHPESAYRGEIFGVRFSNDISSVLPTELALLKNPVAKKLFQLKFAQKQLLSFEYKNMIAHQNEEHMEEEIIIEKKEKKGPVIICVDTSGSMRGTPENIAKTVTFALAKIAIEEERKCYLISFSTGIETLDLSDFSIGKSLEKLVSFLKMSFNGGTDATPALTHAVELLGKEKWKKADVLMVSDFVMGSLPEMLVNSIETEKEKGTSFYSLVIGSSGNKNTIECFNHNWIYDTRSANPSRRLVEQLHELRTREIWATEKQPSKITQSTNQTENLMQQNKHIDVVTKNSYTSATNVNEDVNVKLLKAIINNSYEDVIKWLNADADPNARIPDVDGKKCRNHTALMLACQLTNNKRIVEELIRRGAKVNAKKNSGWTALMSVVQYSRNCKELVEILLDSDADVNAKTKRGNTVFNLINKNENVSSEIKSEIIILLKTKQKQNKNVKENTMQYNGRNVIIKKR